MELYSDVPQTHWAYNNITWATRLKLVQGYPDGTFRPDDNVTRAEATTLTLRNLGVSALVTGFSIALYAAAKMYFEGNKKPKS